MERLGFPFGPNAATVLGRRYLARDADGKPREDAFRMLERVASAVARAEEKLGHAGARARWQKRFLRLMQDGLFLPNSPTLINAGRGLGQLSACFVIPVNDDLDSIFDAVKFTALIHKTGGGTGFSFSRLRPAGDQVASTSGVSSGPVSFISVFDAATEAIKQGGARRGANMGLLGISHPDIECFITAKNDPAALQNFNLSVMVTDSFMNRLERDGDWELINPRDGRVMKTLSAQELFQLMAKAAHAGGEPGVAFYDTMNRANPTPFLGAFEAVNPCGEQPLLPYESCNLGSLDLSAFTKNHSLDLAALEEAVICAVRFLDDVLEVNRFPLPQVDEATRLTRKIGLGVMGFADLLLDLRIPYASDRAVSTAEEIMRAVTAAAREASRHLAEKRGSFPAFTRSVFPEMGVKAMRNATVTTIAPTGTLSLIRGCSSGIEPHFALAYERRVLGDENLVEMNGRFMELLKKQGLDTPGNLKELRASGSARSIPGLDGKDKELFATAHEITAERHLLVQAAFQKYTDNAVSKTINLPETAGVDDVARIYKRAWELGLKGVTVFRTGSRGRQVLGLLPLPGKPQACVTKNAGRCPRCGGQIVDDGGCRTCIFCGASGCE